MAIIRIEDMETEVEVLVFPSAYRQGSSNIISSNVVWIKGRLSLKEEEPKLIANTIFSIEQVFSLVSAINLNLFGLNGDSFEKLKQKLSGHPGDIPVYLHLSTPQKKKVKVLVGNQLFVLPNETLINELESLFGKERISLALK